MLGADQISQLAPDAASLKAGRDQAKPAKWQRSGLREPLLWGEIQGSGKEPYRTAVDLEGPAYQCSCPSRKFPCKHALGLLFVAAENPVQPAEPPPWVAEWRAKRVAGSERKPAKEQTPSTDSSPDQVAEREAAAAKRAGRRDKLMSEGLSQAKLWVEDLLRQGLAWAQLQPAKYWMDQVARLVDAQLPGAARMVEECAAVASSGDGWASRLLAELSRLHLLCRTWPGIERLDPGHAAEVRAALGQPVSQESVLAQDGMSGTWQVLARVYEERDKVRTYRHWLWCHETGRVAQVFEHAAGSQPLDTSLPAGSVFEGELVFYPGVVPRRALIKRRAASGAGARILTAGNDTSLQATVDRSTTLWAAQPWILQLPLAFTATASADAGGFVDEFGSLLRWTKNFPNAWLLVGLGGGRPLHVFGELKGEGFMPLMAAAPDTQRLWIQRFER